MAQVWRSARGVLVGVARECGENVGVFEGSGLGRWANCSTAGPLSATEKALVCPQRTFF